MIRASKAIPMLRATQPFRDACFLSRQRSGHLRHATQNATGKFSWNSQHNVASTTTTTTTTTSQNTTATSTSVVCGTMGLVGFVGLYHSSAEHSMHDRHANVFRETMKKAKETIHHKMETIKETCNLHETKQQVFDYMRNLKKETAQGTSDKARAAATKTPMVENDNNDKEDEDTTTVSMAKRGARAVFQNVCECMRRSRLRDGKRNLERIPRYQEQDLGDVGED